MYDTCNFTRYKFIFEHNVYLFKWVLESEKALSLFKFASASPKDDFLGGGGFGAQVHPFPNV